MFRLLNKMLTADGRRLAVDKANEAPQCFEHENPDRTPKPAGAIPLSDLESKKRPNGPARPLEMVHLRGVGERGP